MIDKRFLVAALAGLITITAGTSDARPGNNRRDRDEEANDRHHGPNWPYVVGTIILLDDGTRCQITHHDANGQPWCIPLIDPDR